MPKARALPDDPVELRNPHPKKTHTPVVHGAAVLALVALLAAPIALTAADQSPRRTDFPVAAGDTDLPPAWPESVGVDSAPLVRLSEYIRKENLDVRSFLVIKDGKLIFERYSQGLTRDYNYELYSPTDDPIYYGAPDRLKLAAETTPKRPPGAEFDYTDINPILASATLGADAGMPLQAFAELTIFKPLGMKHYAWERADDKGLVSSGWGLRLRAVDMAKVGMLVLSGGRWNDRQIVSQAWARTMTAPASAPFYGLYWWINDIVATEPEVHAMGFKGQFIVALPERNAVVVMTSMLPIEGGLRESKNVLAIRHMVNDFVLPALDNKAHVTLTDARRKALLHELELASRSQGKPGAPVDPTDAPKL